MRVRTGGERGPRSEAPGTRGSGQRAPKSSAATITHDPRARGDPALTMAATLRREGGGTSGMAAARRKYVTVSMATKGLPGKAGSGAVSPWRPRVRGE